MELTKKRLTLILLGIISACILSLTLDNYLGFILNKTGYFKAMTPNITEIYETGEYKFTAKISSQGIRDREIEKPKPKGAYRILAIGDSFTYGQGVQLEDTWVKQLESKLRSEGKNVEVINAGKPAASPTDERQICRAYADTFDVDAVIFASFADDLTQAASKEQKDLDQPVKSIIGDVWPILTRIDMQIIGYRRWGNIDAGSKIIASDSARQVLQKQVNADPLILLNTKPEIRQWLIEGRLNPALRIGARNNADFYKYYFYPEAFNYALDAYKKRLGLFKERCSKDKPTIFVFIPASNLVSSYYLPFYMDLGFNMDNRLPSFNLDWYLKPLVQKEGFIFLSALAPFRQDECKNCYYPYDGHLTPEGQKRLSEVILPEIRKLLSQTK